MRRTALLLILVGSSSHAATLTRNVFGWYPSWSQSKGTGDWHWDLLTHVGYFSADLDATGTVTAWNGWNTGAGAALLTEAHTHGVKVVLTVTCFGSGTIHGAVTTGHDAAIAALVDGVTSVGGDGIDLDFESMAAADKDAFTTFTTDLATALRAQNPSAHISLAMPSVNWSGAYDYVALAGVADALIIMGYDYHWASSDPGPGAPLTSGTEWSSYDETWSVDDYLKTLGTGLRGKVWLGVPLYGYDYPSTSQAVPGTATGSASSITYASTETDAVTYGRLWDDPSQTPYYEYQSGGAWHQVWYDDEQSLGLKFDMVNSRDIGGIGLWALGYEGTSGTMWQAIETHFTALAPPDAGPVAGPPDAGTGTPQTGGDLAGACGCSLSSRGRPSAWPLLLLGLLIVRRRR
jgi:MYXO-CTERM domain-containing protein